MANKVSSLVGRVGKYLGLHADWFSAVAEWYEHANRVKKIAFQTFVPGAEPCKVNLSVNSTLFEDRHATQTATTLAWRVVPSQFRRGENELYLWIDREQNRPWHFGAISVEHADALSESQRQHPPKPASGQQVSVTARFDRDFRPHADRWSVDLLNDAVKFRIQLEERLPALEIVVGYPQTGLALNLDVVWDEIEEAVGKRLEQLFRAQEKASRKSASEIREEIDDIKAYRKLHRKHLAEAVRASDETTLQEIMAKNGTAETLLQSAHSAKPPVAQGSFVGKFLVFVVLVSFFGFVAWTNGLISEATKARIRDGWNDLVNRKGRQPLGDAEDRQNVQRIGERGGKTGDVQISLLWNNKNDLDLHVEPPSKEMIYYGHKTSTCGGRLDIDDNVNYATAKVQPVENVYWPLGKAPLGRYKIYVHYFTNHHQPDCQDPTDFTVRLVVRGQVQNLRGQLREDSKERKILVHEFSVD